MATTQYEMFPDERTGQIHFFESFIADFDEIRDAVLVDNTDGIYNGNLLEFKQTISNPNAVLFQAIKYASHRRVKGKPVPKNILLISLGTRTVYVYHSQDYFDAIHKVYSGPASKNNSKFVAKAPDESFDYMTMRGAIRVKELLKETGYMPVRIDENCIVGWAERYFREVKGASKGDFIGDDSGQVRVKGEIRDPKHFKGQILPYTKATNEKFKYLMDRLNDNINKADYGAFYTPTPYCEMATNLLRQAIERVPEGNDYIVLDRCAGTGNLEAVLDDETLSHCVLATYEYYEYKVLQERLGDKVRLIVPPIEDLVEYYAGCVLNADALSKGFVEQESSGNMLTTPALQSSSTRTHRIANRVRSSTRSGGRGRRVAVGKARMSHKR